MVHLDLFRAYHWAALLDHWVACPGVHLLPSELRELFATPVLQMPSEAAPRIQVPLGQKQPREVLVQALAVLQASQASMQVWPCSPGQQEWAVLGQLPWSVPCEHAQPSLIPQEVQRMGARNLILG